MSVSSGSPSTEKAPYDALQDAYVAAAQVPSLFHTDGPASTAEVQRRAIEQWARTYLKSVGAPPELVQDCVQWLQVTRAASPGRSGNENSPTFSPPAGWPHHPRGSGVREDGSDINSSSTKNESGGGANQAPVTVDTNLDVDHCTIARMLADEERQWAAWQGSRYGPPSAAETEDDVFSSEAAQREAWMCWAAVLRDVKIEAAVQQQNRRSRAATHTTLDSLLDYLEVPEAPWLLEDRPSSVLVAADMYMVNRAYANGAAAAPEAVYNTGEDDDDSMNGTGKTGRDTHDMKAVHAYLVRQDPEKPPLRSLIELTLASHLGEQSRAP